MSKPQFASRVETTAELGAQSENFESFSTTGIQAAAEGTSIFGQDTAEVDNDLETDALIQSWSVGITDGEYHEDIRCTLQVLDENLDFVFYREANPGQFPQTFQPGVYLPKDGGFELEVFNYGGPEIEARVDVSYIPIE